VQDALRPRVGDSDERLVNAVSDNSTEQGRKSKTLLDGDQISRTLARMTHEIAEQAPDLGELALVGIQKGGVELATRLADLFLRFYQVKPPTGTIDITFYRDDIDIRLGRR
jgi:pyrimidine operon attenuation protein / uracil phosphoribosyltransferase